MSTQKVNGEELPQPSNWYEPTSTDVWRPAGQPPTTFEVEAVGDGKGYALKKPLTHDPVNHPIHYCHGKIEVIEFLEDQGFDQHELLAVQYILRARHKGSEIQDYQKAIWYLNRRIKLLEKGTEALK